MKFVFQKYEIRMLMNTQTEPTHIDASFAIDATIIIIAWGFENQLNIVKCIIILWPIVAQRPIIIITIIQCMSFVFFSNFELAAEYGEKWEQQQKTTTFHLKIIRQFCAVVSIERWSNEI